jgi:LysM repeat protein
LAVTGDRAQLQEVFARRRIDEIRQLTAINRTEDVDFYGVVEALNGTQWQVAGLHLVVPAEVPGAQAIRINDQVAVQASTTTQGELVARQITLVEPGDEPPPPTPSPVSTLRPTATITATPTPTMTITATPTTSLTPTVTPSRTPPVTIPAPSVTVAGCVPTAPAGWVTFTVQAGDTLSGLAAQTGISLDQLMQVNCLTDSRLIVAGQILLLPFDPSPPGTAPQGSGQIRPSPGSQGGSSSSGSSGRSDDSGSEEDGDDHSGSGGSSGSGGGDDSDDDDNGSSGSGGGGEDDDVDDDD